MPTLGQFLKHSREERDISLEQIEEVTKIRKRYLEAIENGDYKVLPGTFYARAFIKNYAEALGLDSEQIFAKYVHEIPQFSPSTQETVLPKRKKNLQTTSPKVGRWLTRILLYSFMLFVLFLVYMAAVNYLDNLGDGASRVPEITGPTGDGVIKTDGESSGKNPEQENLPKEEDFPEETIPSPQPTWIRVNADEVSTTFEYTGAEEVIITLQAKERVWYSLSDPLEDRVIDTTLLNKDAEKEWDLTNYEQVVLRLGYPPGANLLVNGEVVDIVDVPRPHNLIIHFKSIE